MENNRLITPYELNLYATQKGELIDNKGTQTQYSGQSSKFSQSTMLHHQHNLKVQAYILSSPFSREKTEELSSSKEKTPPKILLKDIRKPRNLILSSKIGNYQGAVYKDSFKPNLKKLKKNLSSVQIKTKDVNQLSKFIVTRQSLPQIKNIDLYERENSYKTSNILNETLQTSIVNMEEDIIDDFDPNNPYDAIKPLKTIVENPYDDIGPVKKMIIIPQEDYGHGIRTHSVSFNDESPSQKNVQYSEKGTTEYNQVSTQYNNFKDKNVVLPQIGLVKFQEFKVEEKLIPKPKPIEETFKDFRSIYPLNSDLKTKEIKKVSQKSFDFDIKPTQNSKFHLKKKIHKNKVQRSNKMFSSLEPQSEQPVFGADDVLLFIRDRKPLINSNTNDSEYVNQRQAMKQMIKKSQKYQQNLFKKRIIISPRFDKIRNSIDRHLNTNKSVDLPDIIQSQAPKQYGHKLVNFSLIEMKRYERTKEEPTQTPIKIPSSLIMATRKQSEAGIYKSFSSFKSKKSVDQSSTNNNDIRNVIDIKPFSDSQSDFMTSQHRNSMQIQSFNHLLKDQNGHSSAKNFTQLTNQNLKSKESDKFKLRTVESPKFDPKPVFKFKPSTDDKMLIQKEQNKKFKASRYSVGEIQKYVKPTQPYLISKEIDVEIPQNAKMFLPSFHLRADHQSKELDHTLNRHSSELQITGIKHITFDISGNKTSQVSRPTPEEFENQMFDKYVMSVGQKIHDSYNSSEKELKSSQSQQKLRLQKHMKMLRIKDSVKASKNQSKFQSSKEASPDLKDKSDYDQTDRQQIEQWKDFTDPVDATINEVEVDVTINDQYEFNYGNVF